MKLTVIPTRALTIAFTITLMQAYFFIDNLEYINFVNPVSFSNRYESEKIILANNGNIITRKAAFEVLLILIKMSIASNELFKLKKGKENSRSAIINTVNVIKKEIRAFLPKRALLNSLLK
ncbi:hypothetical protein rsdtw13_34780 [Clostridium sp. TW13]|uniref:Uncharacterized protein n=1 Tax=Inconstantimicrobium mannanitabidum TaxID=1604901 RepID=A0ACB5RGK3_9CLOT|nr:hypothetical protein rsdtw13_34780 [Clostridium sp. TW13]